MCHQCQVFFSKSRNSTKSLQTIQDIFSLYLKCSGKVKSAIDHKIQKFLLFNIPHILIVLLKLLIYFLHPKLDELFGKKVHPKILEPLSFQCTFINNFPYLPFLICHFQYSIQLIQLKVNVINMGRDGKKEESFNVS